MQQSLARCDATCVEFQFFAVQLFVFAVGDLRRDMNFVITVNGDEVKVKQGVYVCSEQQSIRRVVRAVLCYRLNMSRLKSFNYSSTSNKAFRSVGANQIVSESLLALSLIYLSKDTLNFLVAFSCLD